MSSPHYMVWSASSLSSLLSSRLRKITIPASLQCARHTRYALNVRIKPADSYMSTGLVFLGSPTKDTPPTLPLLGEVW